MLSFDKLPWYSIILQFLLLSSKGQIFTKPIIHPFQQIKPSVLIKTLFQNQELQNFIEFKMLLIVNHIFFYIPRKEMMLQIKLYCTFSSIWILVLFLLE